MTTPTKSTLAGALDARTAEGVLYEKLEDGAVRCFACAHRCLVREGRRGICRVRYNEGGTLRVPNGYVAALQCDPVEKKPFFHVLPGANALTFGMLGCDLHCGYCFPGETVVLTSRGAVAFERLFAGSGPVEQRADAEIVRPHELCAVAGSGAPRRVLGVVRHGYEGELCVVRARYLPAIRCTPDHRVYATEDPALPPTPVEARRLTGRHFLAVPRRGPEGTPQAIEVARELADVRVTHRVKHRLDGAKRTFVAAASERGLSSREIGAALGISASSVRHVRSRIGRGRDVEGRATAVALESDLVRFAHERRPGIPATLPLDPDLAALLGYYCAEGCVVRAPKRPNSHRLVFSLSRREGALAERIAGLLERTLGVRARRVERETTLAVEVSKASAGLLFRALAGGRAAVKRVPRQLFQAPASVVEAFLAAYAEGDGHRYGNGKVSVTTVSRELAYGVAALVLRTGRLASVYAKRMAPDGTVMGRSVRRQPEQLSVVWYDAPVARRGVVETDEHFLVPVKSVSTEPFSGQVYNMEVEEEHNYTAGLLLVSNCQNWVTSQALRDEVAGTRPVDLTAEQLVGRAARYDGRLVVSSYNEPLITSEWAVEVFDVARARGLVTGFVSNGNATAEALDFVRPHADIYKIDLKTMNERRYRQLGAVLQNVLDSIRMVHERGFWLEVVTLVIPGFSSDPGELRAAAEFIASVDRNIPWHVTAFHEDYKFQGMGDTTTRQLLAACEIGRAAGLNFVYAGNLPGRVGEFEHTHCPSCHAPAVERRGYELLANRLTAAGTCSGCGAVVPGLWRNPRGASAPSAGHGVVRPVR